MSSDAHFSFLRRLGPPDHLFNNSNNNSNSNSNSNQASTSSSSSNNRAGLRYYLDAGSGSGSGSGSARDPFPPSIVDRNRSFNQDDPDDEEDEFEEEIGVRLEDRESISLPFHLLPPYQADDLDILPSEAHPSHPYGIPFLPTSLPPYSSKPKLPPLSSNSLQYLSNSHLPPNSNPGTSSNSKPQLGNQNQSGGSSSSYNQKIMNETLSKNLEELPLELKMKSKISHILKSNSYPFKRIGPGKNIKRNPRDFFNKNRGEETQIEIWSDLGLEEILPKGKEKDPLIGLSKDLINFDQANLINGGGGIGGITDWKHSKVDSKNNGKGKGNGLGWLVEHELIEEKFHFFSEFKPRESCIENDFIEEKEDYIERDDYFGDNGLEVPESYAYGKIDTTKLSSSSSTSTSNAAAIAAAEPFSSLSFAQHAIFISELQRNEEQNKLEKLGLNIHSNQTEIENPNFNPKISLNLSHQLETNIGLDRSERIWSSRLRKERIEIYLNEFFKNDEKFEKLNGNQKKLEFEKTFWNLFLNTKNSRNFKGNSVFEKIVDGKRKSYLVRDDVIFGDQQGGAEEGKRKGQIKWG